MWPGRPCPSCDPYPHVSANGQNISLHFAGLNCGEYQSSIWSQSQGLSKYSYWVCKHISDTMHGCMLLEQILNLFQRKRNLPREEGCLSRTQLSWESSWCLCKLREVGSMRIDPTGSFPPVENCGFDLHNY